MDLRRLPPAILIALGLGCGPSVDDGDSDGSGSGVSSTSGGSATGSSGTTTTGPCLDVTACLKFDVPPPTTATETTSGTGEGTGSSGTGPGTGGSTTGPCLAPVAEVSEGEDILRAAPDHRSHPTSRRDVIERLREQGVLPPDVLAKLRDR